MDLKASVAAQKASAAPPPPPPLSSPVTKLAVTAASRYQRANDLLPKTVVRAIFGVFFGIDPLLTFEENIHCFVCFFFTDGTSVRFGRSCDVH